MARPMKSLPLFTMVLHKESIPPQRLLSNAIRPMPNSEFPLPLLVMLTGTATAILSLEPGYTTMVKAKKVLLLYIMVQLQVLIPRQRLYLKATRQLLLWDIL